MNNEMGIGEVAKKVGISTSTLKVGEKEGLIPKARRIKRNKSRVFTLAQVEAIIEFIRGN